MFWYASNTWLCQLNIRELSEELAVVVFPISIVLNPAVLGGQIWKSKLRVIILSPKDLLFQDFRAKKKATSPLQLVMSEVLGTNFKV